MADIEIFLGDTAEIVTPVFDNNTDDYRDLSGLTGVKYSIAEDLDDSEPILSLTLADSAIEIAEVQDIESVEFEDLDPDTDVISVFLEPEDTEALPAVTLQHELQIDDEDGNITTVFQGDVTTSVTLNEPRQS